MVQEKQIMASRHYDLIVVGTDGQKGTINAAKLGE